MTEQPILFRREGAVAVLTLNRPDIGNAIDLGLARALMEAAVRCDTDDSIRCVLLTGTGRMFCAGGDITVFAAAGDGLPALLKEVTGYFHVAISRLARMPKPLVTAINGTAAGGGFSLAILGDVVLAARSAKLTLAYSGIGLSPDGGATWMLPRLVGLRRAQELVMTSKRLSADEAVSIGLVTRAVDDAVLTDEALHLAGELATAATRALGRSRALLLSSFQTSFEEQMELESRAISQSGADSEGRAGIAAFLDKRKPVFPR